eukprot:3999812-Pleurochrysis_carterae.AAC.1
MSHGVELSTLLHEPFRMSALLGLRRANDGKILAIFEELGKLQAKPFTFRALLECGMIGTADQPERFGVIRTVGLFGQSL